MVLAARYDSVPFKLVVGTSIALASEERLSASPRALGDQARSAGFSGPSRTHASARAFQRQQGVTRHTPAACWYSRQLRRDRW